MQIHSLKNKNYRKKMQILESKGAQTRIFDGRTNFGIFKAAL